MCIQAAVRRETTVFNTTSIADLEAGNGFEAVHTTAMFLLASSAIDVTADTIPETLTFDVNRIALVQREYRRIVKGCAMLVTAQHALGGSNAAMMPVQRDVLSKLAALITNGEDVAAMLPSILDDADNMLHSTGEAIITPLHAMLQHT